MKHFLTLILLSSLTTFYAQTTSFYINPIETDNNYNPIQDSHLVVRNNLNNLNKLFLFIGGTGSNTQQMQAISNFAGGLGFDVINLSYPNEVPAASLANNEDSLAFNKFRQEICFGTPSSSAVSVDSLNSIYTRTFKLIHHLHITYPSQNWNQYLLSPNTIDWSKIVIGGHSQGGGHAAFIAKHHLVERVLMFSSPNDYSTFYSKAANWLRTEGLTPTGKHLAYLSFLDELVDFNKQYINLQAIGLIDTTFVDYIDPPFQNKNLLYTSQAPGFVILNHNVTIKNNSKNRDVWEYMLTSTSTLNNSANLSEIDFSVFPNPFDSKITIKSSKKFVSKPYEIVSVNGKGIKKGFLSASNDYSIDVSSLNNGFYLLLFDQRVFKILKSK